MAKIILSANTDWYLFNFRLALARNIREEGADVLMLSPPGPYVEKIREEGFQWTRIDIARETVDPLEDFRTLLSFLHLYRRERPDLVHNFTVKPVIYGSLAGRLAGVHATVSSVTGLGYPFVNPGRRAAALRMLVLPLYRIAFTAPNSKVVFHNAADKEFFVKRRVVSEEAALVIEGSGVDPEEFKPGPEPTGQPVVLMASRMLWDKGVAEIIQAARILKARGVGASIILAGEPDSGYPASVPEIELRAWNQEGIVEWIGRRDDMPELMRQAHIVVLPSYGEGLPRVLLEASASGKAVVATDIPGCRAVVRPGVTGLLVPARDPHALADALENLIVDVELRRRMGKAGREMVEERFSQNLINKQIISIYGELLGGDLG